ncbi:MAG TPA: hypothetical protein DCP97_05005 [Ruminococcaceae bacterium]|nr:hypothetical protein [Oscillospiraceae bacterium]
MSKIIKTLEVERWSNPDENNRIKRIGMANAKEIFDALEKHLVETGLLPDEYFLFHDIKGDLPEFTQAFCNTRFGGSEGIYMNIFLQRKSDGKLIRFATGKTLGESADDFYRMSRIAAECSLMLNGNGSKLVINNEPVIYKLNKNENTSYVIIEQKNDVALLKRFAAAEISDPTPYIVAYGFDINNDLISWRLGEYCNTLEDAYQAYQSHFCCKNVESKYVNEDEDELDL